MYCMYFEQDLRASLHHFKTVASLELLVIALLLIPL